MHDPAAEVHCNARLASRSRAVGRDRLMTIAAASIAKPLLGAALAVLVAAGCFMLMRKRARSAAPLPCAEALGNPPQSDEPAVVQLTPGQAIGAIADDSCGRLLRCEPAFKGAVASSMPTRSSRACATPRAAGAWPLRDCRPRRA